MSLCFKSRRLYFRIDPLTLRSHPPHLFQSLICHREQLIFSFEDFSKSAFCEDGEL